jgi:hypothetical protein
MLIRERQIQTMKNKAWNNIIASYEGKEEEEEEEV